MTKKSDEVMFFIAKTLLFGETAAVYGFNRVARLLEKIAVQLGRVLCTNYFDDYSQLESEELADSAETCLE